MALYHPDQSSPCDLFKRRYKVDAVVIVRIDDIHREDAALDDVVGASGNNHSSEPGHAGRIGDVI
jgi:hypothetical protein